MEFTVKGNGNSELNDVTIPIPTFQLRAVPYSFLIRPKSKYWRFGVRFGPNADSQFGSINSRYSQKEIKHLEICVGERAGEEKKWVGEDRVYLQEYHITTPDQGEVIKGWTSNYKTGDEILFEIKPTTEGNILISCELKGAPRFEARIPMPFAFFRVFGWADNIDFEFDVLIKRGMSIRLNQVKALSGQDLDLDLQDLMVFFGPNNSGKSSIILGASQYFKNANSPGMDYIGPNRFSSSENIDIEKFDQVEHQLDSRKKRNEYAGESENIGPDPMYEYSIIDGPTRETVDEWFNANVDSLSVSRKELGRFRATAESKLGNHSPKVAGTGSRSLLSIVIALLNPNIKFLAIDEPELSLEPRLQKRLFELIKKAASGDDMPQKNVLIATHSHIFLDKEDPRNNFKVSKVAGKVQYVQVQTIEELQEAVYTMLGGTPSDLFFPDNIVVVEGRSDLIFLEAALGLLVRVGICQKKEIVFHFVEGIERAKHGAVAIEEMFKTQTYTPVYKERICGLFDQALVKGAKKVIEGIRDYFKDDGTRFVTLDKDAIEYYYPILLIREIVGNQALTQEELNSELLKFLESFKGKPANFKAEFFGLERSKVDLADEISKQLSTRTDHKILDEQVIGLLKEATKRAY